MLKLLADPADGPGGTGRAGLPSGAETVGQVGHPVAEGFLREHPLCIASTDDIALLGRQGPGQQAGGEQDAKKNGYETAVRQNNCYLCMLCAAKLVISGRNRKFF